MKTPSTITNPALFQKQRDIAYIQANKYPIWRNQPLWPQKNIMFTPSDNTRRRNLIRILTASQTTQALGYQIFKCERTQKCGSPLCNYCRTKLQDRYEKRVDNYFTNAQQSRLCWITIIDDLTYKPVNDFPKWVPNFKERIKYGLENSPFLKSSRAFGAFEIDVKNPAQLKPAALKTLAHYGLVNNTDIAYMPHFHAIIQIDFDEIKFVRTALKKIFKTKNQVHVAPITKYPTKEENLRELSRYMFKFRMQFADNVNLGKSKYGSDFDDVTMHTYAQAVHSIISQRGIRQYEFMYNLSSK